jgi:chromosomal replication initiation ATPase DnaA
MNPTETMTEINSFCSENRGKFNVAVIMRAVCISLRITPDQIQEADKLCWCVDARAIFCLLTRKLTNSKWEAIGLEIGSKSPHSVWKTVRRAKARLQQGQELFTEKTLLVITELKRQL